jgi:hypothetical protein
MKNPSTHFKKAIFGLVLAMGSSAFANVRFVSVQTLLENDIDSDTIQEMVDNKILLLTSTNGRYLVNSPKIEQIIAASDDKELKNFLVFLKSVVGEESDVQIKTPGGMIITSQDGGVAM